MVLCNFSSLTRNNSFLTAKHSRAQLKITRQMLTRILSYHQVSADYLDFLFAFGKQAEPLDLAFSGFRAEKSFKPHHKSVDPDLKVLGRSGKHSKLCYNLKTVATESGPDTHLGDMKWSIRHVAVYHQLDVEGGKTLWILTRGGLDIQSRIQDLTGDTSSPENYTFDSAESSFRSSLAPHLLYSYWAAENWRWYVRWREQVFVDTVSILGSSLHL